MSIDAMSQSDIMRKNISAVAEMQRKVTDARTLQGRLADLITDFSGSMAFVYIHALWFAVWIMLNIGRIHVLHISEFDPYPFGLLTLIVSLEAIFLSTFVLISQNRLACNSERRAELDLQVNLLSEQKATKILSMLNEIAQELDRTSKRFNFAPDKEAEALKVSPEPQEVLQVIEDTVKEQAQNVKAQVKEAVADITGEMEAVQTQVDRTDEHVKKVEKDVDRIKQQVSGQTGAPRNISLN